jgi:hypothetical protein
MALVVGVHGIAQELKGPETLRMEWLPALRDGLRLAGAELPGERDFECVFYGDLFRKRETKTLLPLLGAEDVTTDWERSLLDAWWREAARLDPQVPGPEARTKMRTPQVVQRALNNLSNSRFFASIGERVLIWQLKQVYAYLHDSTVRSAVQARMRSTVQRDTKVVIGHSLGSVVAYEALCANPEWEVSTLVTLGSPLGIPNLIFDILMPQPQGGTGEWPRVAHWFNIADRGDIVALEKQLSTKFSAKVVDSLVNNGATAHSIAPYLTAKETGEAIAAGVNG